MKKEETLLKCKSCNKEVSKNAKSCPHCGEPNPVKKKTNLVLQFLILIFTIWIIYIFLSSLQNINSGSINTNSGSTNTNSGSTNIHGKDPYNLPNGKLNPIPPQAKNFCNKTKKQKGIIWNALTKKAQDNLSKDIWRKANQLPTKKLTQQYLNNCFN